MAAKKKMFLSGLKRSSFSSQPALIIRTFNRRFSVSGLITNNGFKMTVNVTGTTNFLITFMWGHWHEVTTYVVKVRNFGLFRLLDGHLSSVTSIRSFRLDDRIVPHIQLDIWCKLRQWQFLAVKTESLTSHMISRQMWLHITWVSHSYYNFTTSHVFGCGQSQTAV